MLLFDRERLGAAMDEAGLEALIATTASNVLYLTRYRGPERALAVVCREDLSHPVLILPASDIEYFLEDPTDEVRVLSHGRFFRFVASGVRLTERERWVIRHHEESRVNADPWQLAAEVIQTGAGRKPAVGVDAGDGAALAAALPGARVERAAALFRRVRMVKTAEEIRRIAEAARITEAAIEASVANARPGVTQQELTRAFNIAVAAADARTRLDNISIDGGAAFGNLNIPGDRIEEGSVIRYDVGVVHGGYCSDISRCFACRTPRDKAVRYHEALLEGQERALEWIRPGVTAAEVFHQAVTAVRKAGIPHYDRTHVGHGIGLAGAGYDAPLLAPSDQTVLEAGMVLCVELPYYEFGFAGLQVEDMVEVTPTGYRFLTRTDRRLRVLA